MKNDNTKLSLKLYNRISLKEPIEINENIKDSLLQKLKEIYKIKKPEEIIITIQLLYFHRKEINEILYFLEEIIIIKKEKPKLYFFFYLALLIEYEPVFINFIFPFNYIEEIHSSIKTNEKTNDKYIKIIKAKINIDLIYNYKGLEESDENERKEKLKQIEDDYKEIFSDNNNIITIGKKIDENYIKENNIDKIYIDIILSLIKENKFEEFENIFNQLDLENIYLTKTMINELNNYIKDYMNDYMILNVKDLYNEKTINFHYMLLKYIIKNEIYVELISLLNETKKNIEIIIDNDKKITFCEKKEFREKLEYLIKFITDKKISKFLKKIEYQLLTYILNKINDNNSEKDNKLNINDTNFVYYLNCYFNKKIDKNDINELITEEEYKYFEDLKKKNQQSTKDSYKNKEDSKFFYRFFGKKEKKEEKEEKENKQNNYIKQLSNGFLIIGGDENLKIYDQSYTIIKNFEIYNNNAFEIGNYKNNIEVAICSDKIFKIMINNNKVNELQEKISKGGFLYFENESNSYICNHNGLFTCNKHNPNNKNMSPPKERNKQFIGGNKIDMDIIALISKKNELNESNEGDEEELIFYNLLSEKDIKTIKGYSFILSSINNFVLLPKSEENNKDNNKEINKLLIYACTINLKEPKNGFLLINIKRVEGDPEIKISEIFYDTGNFEVTCFCPYTVNKYLDCQKNENKNSDYFLAAVYDKENNRGLIKVYKLISNKEVSLKKTIEFIKYNNKYLLDNIRITSILQSTIEGAIILTCDNGEMIIFNQVDFDNINDSIIKLSLEI